MWRIDVKPLISRWVSISTLANSVLGRFNAAEERQEHLTTMIVAPHIFLPHYNAVNGTVA